MNYLSVENLSKHYGERVLFENLYFGLSQGDKVALIANNGAGKSTLLKILVGKDVPDGGKVTTRNGIRIGFLDQEPLLNMNQTVSEFIKTASSEVHAVIHEYERALHAQAENYNEKTHEDFEKASHRMNDFQAWDHDRRMKTILAKFNITEHEQRIETLSGGERKRLALALLLLDNPELIILDEPTNHLDVEMIEWLEDYLTRTNVTLLMVTHDRYFLDRVCNEILELTDGKLYTHIGNYSYFLEKREAREQVYDVEAAKTKKLLKHELEWMRKMPKARTTKSKSRIDAFYDIKEKANSRKIRQELKLQVKMSRMGGKILEMKKVYKSYGETKILSGFDYTFKKGERIGIVGKNGVGKTTFLNIITGKDTPDSGKVNTGDTIIYGYYTQSGIKLKEDKRVLEVVREIADYIQMGDGSKLSASQLLQHFMFPAEMQYTFVSSLSGGEKRRLYLLTVLIKNPNFLILDEPTNDLDILTLNTLEEFLLDFGGCLLVVSHDRYFMDKLVDNLFIFAGDGNIRNYIGTYTEYRNEEAEKEEEELSRKKEEKSAARKVNAVVEEKSKKKISFKEKTEYEKLEKEIAALEKEKSGLEAELNSRNIPYTELSKKTERIAEIIEQLETKAIRWIELGELI